MHSSSRKFELFILEMVDIYAISEDPWKKKLEEEKNH